MSLRWRLILLAGSVAIGTELVLSSLSHHRAQQLLQRQLEERLESKCDEVISLLESAPAHLTLEHFFHTQTEFAPHTYFYQVRDAQGRILARSPNLGDVEVPIPAAWKRGERESLVTFQTVPHPISPENESVRMRTERVRVRMAGGGSAALMIQTAIALGPLESAARQTLRDAVLISAFGLGSVFFLLWFVTTRSLHPVSAMTRKARKISPTNLHERLPLAGGDDKLDELASVLNGMLDRLGASLRQMEQFASGAAHQLRTRLTRIRGELDLVLRGDVAGPTRSELERVQEQIERLSSLCGRLLLLARLDQQAGHTSLIADRVDLEELVDELIELMRPLALDRGVALGNGASSAGRVLGSRPLLLEALHNLLDNAIHVTPPGGSVAVSVESNGDVVRLSVEDNGPGIAPEERERIFEPFYRTRRTLAETTYDGSGLGLAIVRRIAEAHGGRVEFVEAPKGGSIFRLVLPAQRVS